MKITRTHIGLAVLFLFILLILLGRFVISAPR
jgi:hypothetical protein